MSKRATPLKKKLHISIDEDLYRLHRLKHRNASQFFNELLKKELAKSHGEKWFETIRRSLMQDEEFIAVMRGEETSNPDIAPPEDYA